MDDRKTILDLNSQKKYNSQIEEDFLEINERSFINIKNSLVWRTQQFPCLLGTEKNLLHFWHYVSYSVSHECEGCLRLPSGDLSS